MPRPVVYGKGKGPHGVAPMSWPQRPLTTPTPRAVNEKRPITEAPDSTSPPIAVFTPTLLTLALV